MPMTYFLFVFLKLHFIYDSNGSKYGSIQTPNDTLPPSIVAVTFTSKKLSIKYNVDIARKFPSLLAEIQLTCSVYEEHRKMAAVCVMRVYSVLFVVYSVFLLCILCSMLYILCSLLFCDIYFSLFLLLINCSCVCFHCSCIVLRCSCIVLP
jgi:hypothetical protein